MMATALSSNLIEIEILLHTCFLQNLNQFRTILWPDGNRAGCAMGQSASTVFSAELVLVFWDSFCCLLLNPTQCPKILTQDSPVLTSH
jgi:hypothetical protein